MRVEHMDLGVQQNDKRGRCIWRWDAGFSGRRDMPSEDVDFGIILDTQLDRRIFSYLLETFGREAVETASTNLAARRRPYVSNIVKALGASVPDRLLTSGSEVADQHIDA